MTTFALLKDELRKEYEIRKSWARIAECFPEPITRAHIFRIVRDGWEPERADIREALGLSPLHLVEGCPICHAIHTHKHGEQTYDPAASVVKPLRKPGKPRAPRIAISKENATSAFHSMYKNMNESVMDELETMFLYRKWARENKKKEM